MNLLQRKPWIQLDIILHYPPFLFYSLSTKNFMIFLNIRLQAHPKNGTMCLWKFPVSQKFHNRHISMQHTPWPWFISFLRMNFRTFSHWQIQPCNFNAKVPLLYLFDFPPKIWFSFLSTLPPFYFPYFNSFFFPKMSTMSDF